MKAESRREADERERAALEQIQIQVAARDRRSVVSPSTTRSAWSAEVDLTPHEVVAVLEGSGEVVAVPMSEEEQLPRNKHTAKVLLDNQGTELALWQRPRRSAEVFASRERIPYPDFLRVRIEATSAGCRLLASWHRHPATVAIKRRNSFWSAVIIAGSALPLLSGHAQGWIGTVVIALLGLYWMWDMSRMEIPPSMALTVLEEAITPHRLSPNERLPPYRADARQPRDEQ
ncbi:MAG: hypothetical protein AAF799_25140 [Myxococcota bacterium]